ncbi:MAG: hypothetical protein ACKV19_06315 [Verrucomicrobiales bacterium]
MAILVVFGAVLALGVLVLVVVVVLVVGIVGIVMDVHVLLLVPLAWPTSSRGCQPRLRFLGHWQALWRRLPDGLVGSQSAKGVRPHGDTCEARVIRPVEFGGSLFIPLLSVIVGKPLVVEVDAI